MGAAVVGTAFGDPVGTVGLAGSMGHDGWTDRVNSTCDSSRMDRWSMMDGLAMAVINAVL